MISDNTIQEIKERIDIVEVVGDFVDLKKSGSSYKALSPLHQKKLHHFLYLHQSKYLNVLAQERVVTLLNF